MQGKKEKLSLQNVSAGLVAGLVLGILNVAICVAFGALIFSGDLGQWMSVGIGLSLFGALLIGGIVALFSSYSGMIATPQDIPSTILALVASAIALNLGETSPEAVLPTIIAAIASTALLTGVFFFLLGHFRLGNLVRFIPYPVIGGFLAGIGWLLVIGGIGVMTGSSGDEGLLSIVTSPDLLLRWLPGLAFGGLLLVVSKVTRHFLSIPLVLLGGVFAFYLAIHLAGMTPGDAETTGWLLGPFPDAGLWEPLEPSTIGQVDWKALFGNAGNLCTILVMSIISILLNASGMELALRQDIDLNRELKVAGIANVLSAAGSGVSGYHALSNTMLASRLGGPGRMVGVMAALICGLALFFGAGFMGYFPKLVAGGLLIFLGLLFLTEWVLEAYRRLPRTDYCIVLVILVVIVSVGLLEGVGVGMALAVTVFLVKYSRVEIVKHALSGAGYQWRVERSQSKRKLLEKEGGRIQILVLQGYVFFGTANNLLNAVRELAAGDQVEQLDYVILDFRLVSGVDSSAVSSFVRAGQLAETQGFTVLFTQLKPDWSELLHQGLEAGDGGRCVKFFEDLDSGMEWCEDRILESAEPPGQAKTRSTRTELRMMFPGRLIERAMSFFETQGFQEGEALMRQGRPSDSMYFIDSGGVTVSMDTGDGPPVRLQTLRTGTVVGEIGLYVGGVRTASVIADEPTIAHRLTVGGLDKMSREDPEAGAAFHRYVVRMLAERLAATDRMVRYLL